MPQLEALVTLCRSSPEVRVSLDPVLQERMPGLAVDGPCVLLILRRGRSLVLDPTSLDRATVPTAETIYARHDRRRVRVSLPQLRMAMSLWYAVNPCTTKELTARGPVATTVRTLRSLENRKLVRSGTKPDPDTGHPVTVYDLTDAGHAFVCGLVADTPVTPPAGPTRVQAPATAQRTTATVDTTRAPASNSPTSVSEVLDFFARCPRCGYAATATRTTRERDGEQEISLHPTCGLPCGWSGPVHSFRARTPRR
ncbi:hypothetical protein ACTD5D_23205 [Nocardia takedensis]|uniref:hypothetical protein n=1 Tax=Nocardia takedensis TaxID=259390 RepID=UPI003F776479